MGPLSWRQHLGHLMHHALGHGQGAAADIDHHQQFALRVHRRPHPGGRALQTLDGFRVADLAGFARSQHGVQLIELELLQVESTQEIRGKGAELLGRFAQPLQHRGGSNLEDASRGTDPQSFSQTGHNPHDALHCGLFAVEKRAVGLEKVTLARRAVELAPGAAARMAMGAQIAQTAPASVVTTGMRTAMARGIDLTGPPIRWGHGIGRHRRRRVGRHGVAFTQGAMGLVRQALEGFGLVGAVACGLKGLRLRWCGQSWQRALGPGEVQDDKEPNECKKDQLIEKKR